MVITTIDANAVYILTGEQVKELGKVILDEITPQLPEQAQQSPVLVDYYTQKEVQELYKVDAQKLYRMRKAGKLQCAKVAGSNRYLKSHIEEVFKPEFETNNKHKSECMDISNMISI